MRHRAKLEQPAMIWPRPKAGSRSTYHQQVRGAAIMMLTTFGCAAINAAGRWSMILIVPAVACFGVAFAEVMRPWGREK